MWQARSRLEMILRLARGRVRLLVSAAGDAARPCTAGSWQAARTPVHLPVIELRPTAAVDQHFAYAQQAEACLKQLLEDMWSRRGAAAGGAHLASECHLWQQQGGL